MGNGQYTSSSVCPVVLPPPMCSYCHRGTEMKLDPLVHLDFASSSRLYRYKISRKMRTQYWNSNIIKCHPGLHNGLCHFHAFQCAVRASKYDTVTLTPQQKASEQGNSSNMRATKEAVGHYPSNRSCYRSATLVHRQHQQPSRDLFGLFFSCCTVLPHWPFLQRHSFKKL